MKKWVAFKNIFTSGISDTIPLCRTKSPTSGLYSLNIAPQQGISIADPASTKSEFRTSEPLQLRETVKSASISRKSVISILALTTLSWATIGCTKLGSNSDPVGNSTSSPGSPAPQPQTSSNSQKSQQIKSIVAGINSQTTSLEQGLNEIHTLLAQDTTTASPDNSGEIQDLAEAVFEIRQGNPVQNLAVILMNEAFAGGNFDQKISTTPKTIGGLFDLLAKNPSLLPNHLRSDDFLISFLTLYKKNFDDSTDHVFGDEVEFEKVRNYFNSRIADLHSKNLSDQELTTEFNVYSSLNGLLEDSSWLFSLYRDKIDQIDTNTISAAASIALSDLFKNIPQSNFSLTEKSLQTVITLAGRQVERIQTNSQFDETVQSSLENLAALFDLPIDRYNLNFDQWVNALDNRLTVLTKFEKYIRNCQLQKDQGKHLVLSGVNPFLHPYLNIYYGRALSEIQKAGPNANGERLDQFLQEMSHQMQTSDFSINLVLPAFQTVAFSPITTILSPSMTVDKISQMPAAERMDTYRAHLMSVDMARFYFENTLSIHNPIQDRHSRKRLEYQALKTTLADALCLRTMERLKQNGFECDSYKNPSLSVYTKIGYDVLDFSKTDSSGSTNGVQHVLYTKSKPIGAGIYVADTDMVLEGANLEFHPLAMILAPGKSITLKADQIMNAWVDVSSEDMPTQYMISPSGIRPYLHSDKNMSSTTVFSYSPACVFDDYHSPGMVIMFQRGDLLFSDIIDIYQGQEPPQPMTAKSASSAGSITINTSHNKNSLLIAMGGNGQSGYMGGDSPMCSGGIYHTYHGGLCAENGGPFYREKYGIGNGPAIPNLSFLDGGQSTLGYPILLITYNVDVNAGMGGNGGAGGIGGSIDIPSGPNVGILTLGGLEGAPGASGSCAPPNAQARPGASGTPGQNGTLKIAL